MGSSYANEGALNDLKASLYAYIYQLKEVAHDGHLPFQQVELAQLNRFMDSIHTVADFHKFLASEDGAGPASFLGPNFGMDTVKSVQEDFGSDAWKNDRRGNIDDRYAKLNESIEKTAPMAKAESECSASLVCSLTQKLGINF